jgi:hypothetical protein
MKTLLHLAIALIVVLAGINLSEVGSAADGLTLEQQTLAETQKFIADGEPVELKEYGVSLTPPAGWEVYTEHPNLTLLMQTPYVEGMKYQRTIQVASFDGVKYIDEDTAKEFEELIVRKFSRASASVESYRIRNHLEIQLDDGRKGLLFYSELMLDGVSLMQGHILISNDKRHFLMTYTDLAQHFEDDTNNQYLTEAWNAMTSARLEGPSPARFEQIYIMGGAVGGFVVLCLLIYSITRLRARKRFEGLDVNEGDDTSHGSMVTAHSAMATAHSDIATGHSDIAKAPNTMATAHKEAELVSEHSETIHDDEALESNLDMPLSDFGDEEDEKAV